MGNRRVLLLSIWAVLFSVGAKAAPIDLPLRVWVARDAPQPGEGIAGGKHIRPAVNGDNGRVYFEGGDYSAGDGTPQSGRQETYSYSIAEDRWYLEYPFCAPTGVQPSGPDQVTWVWDSKRHQFWMIPGFQWSNSPCPNSVMDVMIFDPIVKRWSVPDFARPLDERAGSILFGAYDPVTDTIIRFAGCGCGAGVYVYDIASNTSTRYCFDCATFPRGFNSDYSAIDIPGRSVYVLDPANQVLVRYHIDSHTAESLGPLPDVAVRAQIRIAWDSTSRVLLWVNGGSCTQDPPPPTRAWAFHPDTNVWEGLPLTQPEGLPVSGTNLVYDPGQNALLLTGCPSSRLTGKFWLYRYGNGPGGAPGDSVPPSPPMNLRTR